MLALFMGLAPAWKYDELIVFFFKQRIVVTEQKATV